MYATNVTTMTDSTRPIAYSETIQYRVHESTLGPVAIAASEQGICAILFGDDKTALEKDLAARFPTATLIEGEGEFDRLADSVARYIDQPSDTVEFPLDPSGTDFQQRVWRALREIAPGTTASYKDVAMRIGSPKAVRAIARACAANPIAVAIPCHRVVRSDGSMSGYRWGTARKRMLLDREARS